MLTERGLIALERSLRGRPVLSVYVSGRVADPADRDRWRVELDAALARAGGQLRGAAHADRAAFERATEAIVREIAPADTVGAPGWVAFATADGIQRVDDLPVPVPLGVYYETGIHLSPALRALKESRPAIVAIVDSRLARFYRYRGAMLERAGAVRAHAHVEPPSHMGTPPRRGFHTGTRGSTGADAAARERRAGRARMMRDVAARLERLAGVNGWILLGGTPAAAREARAALPARKAERVLVVPALQIWSTEAEITERAAWGATELRRREDLAAVRVVLERRAANGHGAARLAATRRALEAGAVQRLFVTLHFLEGHPDEAEAIVREAIAERARVEVVSGDGAELLDAEGDGVGALLRFSPAETRQRRPPRKTTPGRRGGSGGARGKAGGAVEAQGGGGRT